MKILSDKGNSEEDK